MQYPGTRFVTAGEAWREVRNQWIIPYGGSLLLIVLLALGIFYFAKGPLGHHQMGTHPRGIERFTPFERATHWSNAIAFVALGLSGIVMAFGKFFLLPLIGQTLFGYLTYLLKNVHNFAGPLFAVSLVLMIFTREPSSAKPIASVSLLGPARKLTSVVVTASRPTSGDVVVVCCC